MKTDITYGKVQTSEALGRLVRAHRKSRRLTLELGNLRKMPLSIAALLLENLFATKATFEARFGDYPALQCIERIVTRQCRSIAKR
jgi:hypothetical protein